MHIQIEKARLLSGLSHVLVQHGTAAYYETVLLLHVAMKTRQFITGQCSDRCGADTPITRTEMSGCIFTIHIVLGKEFTYCPIMYHGEDSMHRRQYGPRLINGDGEVMASGIASHE